MALPKYVNTGTASVANGATAVTGVGTAWNNIVRADDVFRVEGNSVRIASVTDNTRLTLAEPWPGTSLTADPYEIAITYDGPEFQLRVRQLLEQLGVADDLTATVADRLGMAALDTTIITAAILNEGNRSGLFVWMTGDYSALVALDTAQGIYVESDDIASSVGAWVRVRPNNEFNVLWFGADPTYTTNSSTAILACRDLMQEASNYRGGIMRIPRGRYKVNAEIEFTYYAAGSVHNIIVSGEGPQATVLDFSSAVGGSDGISFGKGIHFGIENLSILSPPQDGISLIGGTLGSSDYISHGFIRNVRIQSPGRNGIRAQQAWGITLDDVWVKAPTAEGINFVGNHTTIVARKCYVSWESVISPGTVAGWSINGVAYSKFDSCGSDFGRWGYVISNLKGVSFNNCGAEWNSRDAILARTSDASATDILTEYQGLSGVTINNFFAFHNSYGNVGTYAGILNLVTANSRPGTIHLEHCVSVRDNASDISLVVNGASGLALVAENGNVFDGSISLSGTYQVWGRWLDFTPTIVGTSTAGAGTYSVQLGRYIIQDGKLHAEGQLTWSAHTGTGNTRVGALPVAHKSGPAVPVTFWASNLTYSGQLAGYIDSGASQLTLLNMATGAGVGLQALDTAASLGFVADYEIA